MILLGSLLLIGFAFAQSFEELDKKFAEEKQKRLIHELQKEKRRRKREIEQENYLEKLDKIRREKELIKSMEIQVEIEGQVGNIFIGKKLFIPDGAITPYGNVNVEARKIGKYNINLYDVRTESGGNIGGSSSPPFLGGGDGFLMLPPPPPPPPPPPSRVPQTPPSAAPPAPSQPLPAPQQPSNVIPTPTPITPPQPSPTSPPPLQAPPGR